MSHCENTSFYFIINVNNINIAIHNQIYNDAKVMKANQQAIIDIANSKE